MPATPAQSASTAAALIIGNELLTGKIDDVNVVVLARELFGLGIRMRRVIVCPDEIEVIVDDLRDLSAAHDYVFTSGGVGPTHDDVTMEAVARAFDRPLVRSAELERLLRGYFGDRVTEGHLRQADVPEGSDLVSTASVRWPTVRMRNVFVLPGLPEVFRMKMPLLREVLDGGPPFRSLAVPTASDEGVLAPILSALDARFPAVDIGSYPLWGDGPVRVRVTFDGRDAVAVEQAAEAFVAALPPDQVISDEVAED
ncbi:MAG: competence/damage-inducible protein A [Acidobacteriota bacterium]